MSTLLIRPPAGTYRSGTPVTIEACNPSARIFYTLDGSIPSPASKIYRGPILLGQETTALGVMRLRAMALTPDGTASPVAGAEFQRAEGLAIRFLKPAAWSSAYIHYWGSLPHGPCSAWPGEPMTPVGDGWYRFDLPGQTAVGLVFNDADGAQTADLAAESPDVWFVGEERWEVDPVRCRRFVFPGGFAKALVVSMDDGRLQDRRLVPLLESHGIRGTFHLNSGKLGEPGYIGADEVATLYAKHEVSTHSVRHPYLTSLARDEIAFEIGEDRAALTRLSGQDVRGHAYPFSVYNDTVIEVLREQGIVYARNGSRTPEFQLPGQLLAWKPSCHHTGAADLADAFLSRSDDDLSLFFVYGHSYEFDSGAPTNNWDYLESLAERLGGRDDIWYATAIEVAEYIRALRAVTPSLAEDRLYNPGPADLWLRADRSPVKLPAGGEVPGVLDLGPTSRRDEQ